MLLRFEPIAGGFNLGLKMGNGLRMCRKNLTDFIGCFFSKDFTRDADGAGGGEGMVSGAMPTGFC